MTVQEFRQDKRFPVAARCLTEHDLIVLGVAQAKPGGTLIDPVRAQDTFRSWKWIKTLHRNYTGGLQ